MKNLTNYVDVFLYVFAFFMVFNINLDEFHDIAYYSSCSTVYVSLVVNLLYNLKCLPVQLLDIFMEKYDIEIFYLVDV